MNVLEDCNDQEERRNLTWEIYVKKPFIKNIILDDNEEFTNLEIILEVNGYINEEKA